MRYFFDFDGNSNPDGLFRFDQSTHTENRWNGDSWVSTEKVTRQLVLGDGWLEEVDEEAAKHHFPDAFNNI